MFTRGLDLLELLFCCGGPWRTRGPSYYFPFLSRPHPVKAFCGYKDMDISAQLEESLKGCSCSKVPPNDPLKFRPGLLAAEQLPWPIFSPVVFLVQVLILRVLKTAYRLHFVPEPATRSTQPTICRIISLLNNSPLWEHRFLF